MRRIVVLGARSPLGQSVLHALGALEGVELVRGIENREEASRSRSGKGTRSDIEVVMFTPDHRPLAAYLDDHSIDTVIQCGLVQDREGLSTSATPADVIATMCAGAAIGHKGSSVRSWVVVSSSAIYPIGSHSPLLNRETQTTATTSTTTSTTTATTTSTTTSEEEIFASSIAEAEDYAVDLATRLPHVNVAILRLQQLIGPNSRGPLAALLDRRLTPVPMGFDPAIQLLHTKDAGEAIAFAAKEELAGVYNVASSGTIRLSEALNETGNTRVPVLPIRSTLLEPLFARVGVPSIPSDLHDLLLFGHAVDTQKIERAGWRPGYDQQRCLGGR